MAVTVKDLSIKTWCSVNVCLPRWRYSLFTITDQVSSLGSLPTLSFAIPRPGQRALDITASVQNFVSPQNGFAWFWQLGPGGLAQADSIKQCWVAFWWRESCETSEGLMPARGATSHHNQETRTLLASTGCQGPGREEREGHFAPAGVLQYTIRYAASCCNGKNKTFTLSLKPTGEWLRTNILS